MIALGNAVVVTRRAGRAVAGCGNVTVPLLFLLVVAGSRPESMKRGREVDVVSSRSSSLRLSRKRCWQKGALRSASRGNCGRQSKWS